MSGAQKTDSDNDAENRSPVAEDNSTGESRLETSSEGYAVLDADKVLDTVGSLKSRISERFPESGLWKVCVELEQVCARSKERIEWISRPIWPFRALRYLLIGLILTGIVVTIFGLRPMAGDEPITLIELIQTLEAALNDVILISVGIFFVWTLESRLKCRRALRALHELRSIAHVIDMHQLTKDPDRINTTRRDTRSSPRMSLDAFQLRRYLDYCSEMLSLVGKVAALHLRKLDDATVVAAVNEIEALTTGLSEKIWQKIDMIGQDES